MTRQENRQAMRQTAQKYLVFAAMFIAFGACMWWIFSPSASERKAAETQAGFNASIPDPEGAGIVGDKKTAYEEEQQRLINELTAQRARLQTEAGRDSFPGSPLPALHKGVLPMP